MQEHLQELLETNVEIKAAAIIDVDADLKAAVNFTEYEDPAFLKDIAQLAKLSVNCAGQVDEHFPPRASQLNLPFILLGSSTQTLIVEIPCMNAFVVAVLDPIGQPGLARLDIYRMVIGLCEG